MSEFHPNRTKQIRTRPKLTARRILECWPLLVWAAVLFAAYKTYSSGVVFVRMNGAVDVYQENITPINEGRLLEIKVKRGERVAPGTVVATMDSSLFKQEMESLRREIVANRTEDVRDYDFELIKLESELRETETAEAEDAATIKELEAVLEEFRKPRPGEDPRIAALRANDVDTQRSRVELAKAKGRNALNAQHLSKIREDIARTKGIRDTLAKEAEIISKSELGSEEVTKIGALREDEFQQYIEIKTKIDLCELKTPHGGTVDRVEKEIGEFVQVGESVLRIVGDPEQVICFLPQDQANQLSLGQKVWVASTSNKADIFESTVTGISPRINNLPDTSSPLPNRRVHGRDVVIAYPQTAMAKAPGEPWKLVPGQTVIIHTEKPGEIPLLDKIFHNDDNDKVR